jgi:mono/diheme cytochrome c family protein
MATVRIAGISVIMLVLVYALASCGPPPQSVPTPTPPPAADTGTDETTATEEDTPTEEEATPAVVADADAETDADTEIDADAEVDTDAEPTETPIPEPTPTYPPMSTANIEVDAGQHLYGEVCAPCHGFRATGIDGIGVNLTTSEFVAGLTSEQLAQFLIHGEGINNPFNESNIKMPPRGGRPDLSDQEMLNIAAYLQNINTTEPDPQAEPVVEYLDWVESGGPAEVETTPEVGQGGLTGTALEGQTTYLRFCAVCHGPNGEGVESLGKGFQDSDFIDSLSDDELAQFIEQGRNADDRINETGIEMLPYGGQPYLTDDQLSQLVDYIRVASTGELLPPVPSDTEADSYDEMSSEEHEQMEVAAFNIIENTTPRCFACHLISERGNENGPGPHLNGLADRAGERVEGMSAEEYIRQSILDPGAFIVEQCPRGPCVDVMVKNYDEKLSDEEMDILVSFLLSLPGEDTSEDDMIADDEGDEDAGDDDAGDDDESDDDAGDDEGNHVRAIDLMAAWVDQGAEEGDFTFTAEDGEEYTANFERDVLDLFVTPGIWYEDSEACINCHFENSEDSDHEMNLGTYDGIMAGGDVLSEPPGVPIVVPGDWENSMLRHRLRDTRMPPDPGWEWDETEENRDGPTLTIDGGDVRAVHLLGAWVDQGAEEGEFSFADTEGVTRTATFDADVLPLFTETGAWYADSSPCIDCHFEQSEDSDHEMDMSNYDGIMAGADVLSEPPGVPIIVPGDWENSVLRDRLRNTRMPPSPGWEWDRTEENRDGPTLHIPQP